MHHCQADNEVLSPPVFFKLSAADLQRPELANLLKSLNQCKGRG